MDLIKDYFKKPKTTQVIQDMSLQKASMSRLTNVDTEVDQLLAKRGYQIYLRDMMADDQVKSCVMIKKLGVTIGGYSIIPAVDESHKDYEKAKEIADFVSYVITRMSGSMSSVLGNIAHAIVAGFSINEIIWDIIEEEGDYKGLFGIAEIKVRPANTITFNLDEFGNVLNLVQTIMGTKTDMPLDKVLLFTYDPQATGLPQGVSDLRAAFRHYWSKDALMRFRNVAAEKYAAPTVVGKYPLHFTKAQQDDLLSVIKNFTIDTAIVVPIGAEIELLEAKGSVVMPYDSSVDACNRGIARAIFGQTLATDEGKDSGSFAQAKIHRGILGMFLDGLRKDIEVHVLYEQLVKRLVDYNYGLPLYPSISLAPINEQDLLALSTIVEKLVNVGIVDKNESFIRERLGFPPKPKELIERDLAAAETAPSIDPTQVAAQPVQDTPVKEVIPNAPP